MSAPTIVVTGSRDHVEQAGDRALLAAVRARLAAHTGEDPVIHVGDATGLDDLVRREAFARRWPARIFCADPRKARTLAAHFADIVVASSWGVDGRSGDATPRGSRRPL